MSEEILKALMQLFALIVKQDSGVELSERDFIVKFLTKQLNDEAVKEYIALFDQFSGGADSSEDETKKAPKLTSVRDSVKILGICKKINKTLNQEQKMVVLVRLFELVNADRKFSEQRMAIINTVAEVFNVSKDEYADINDFVIETDPDTIQIHQNILIVNDKDAQYSHSKHIKTHKLNGDLFILHLSTVNLYFLKYTGNEELNLNGLAINNKSIYLFASGSTVKLPKSKPIYYSDVVSHYLTDVSLSKISYQCNNVEFRFNSGTIGVDDVSFAEEHGRLIGIMGVSGAGKTTLLNVLAGIERPSSGEVLINGFDLHTRCDQTEGVIGLIPQDDLLIEELTVFENLYYNAKLCFKDKTEDELNQMVDKTLNSLGLFDYKHLKVGSPMNKTISGGQRKRLNIALELIREPSILFVDEPTSGLSSRDSENVMDLLRELSLKGKLIFVVIHQPSSEIYKMFDKLMLLDVGGRMIYYGNPIEAVMYFKRMDAQINSDVGECPTCGNVNPEIIFNIVEARVVDEYGNYTDKRKVSPMRWKELFNENVRIEKVDPIHEKPPKSLDIPSWFKQVLIYSARDFVSKISNKQYIVLNLLEAPVLGFILSYIIRYIADPESSIYLFRENENIPIYIFMSIIVALFLGLTVSAEEIFKDRKILKRESFLNLSRSSYLVSKILILMLISAIQSLTFILIANTILGLNGMYFTYWFALFSTSLTANMLGLNISATFNSVVTIYIMIPLVMIPMMVLSGAMFEFDKLNRSISSVNKVPFIADMMPTKWTYEALVVHQFKDNKFEKIFYEYDKQSSMSDFMQVYTIPELTTKVASVIKELKSEGNVTTSKNSVSLLRNELNKEVNRNPQNKFEYITKVTPDSITLDIAYELRDYLDQLSVYYADIFNKAQQTKEKITNYWLETNPVQYEAMRQGYSNESIEDLVKKVFEKKKILEFNNELIQQIDPVFQDASNNKWYDFRTHFYAPRKPFLGKYFDTYWFNVSILWVFSVFFYVALYFEWLKKLLDLSIVKKKAIQ